MFVRPLKKAHLPSACPGVSLRPDAIQSSYARQIADTIYELRLKLLVRCIGPSRHPRAGGHDSCTLLLFFPDVLHPCLQLLRIPEPPQLFVEASQLL